MAQKNQILIPISFEFRAAKFQWTQVTGRVTGWKREKGAINPQLLLVGIDPPSDNSDSIAVHITRLPATLQKQCLATLGKSKPDVRVNQICSEFEINCLKHSEKLLIGDAAIKKHTKPFDAWLMRR